MWRTLSKRVSSRKIKISPSPKFFVEPQTTHSHSSPGFRLIGIFSSSWCAEPISASSSYRFGFSGSSNGARAYGTAAEVISSEEYSSGPDDLHELVERMKRQSQFQSEKKQKKMIDGIEIGKYHELKQKQVKLETEAWENAAREYQELMDTMCNKKLAPNLPYVKSLFLGWFQPLCDAIKKDQEYCRETKMKPNYAPYFVYLEAGKMAAITMHQLMALMMTNSGGPGSCRVVQAAVRVGEAIEHEVRILRFLENNTKKKKKKTKDTEPVEITEDQKKLRKTVRKLINKNKVHKVRSLVKFHHDSQPWGQDVHAKVGSRLIQLLTETAYIQPPVAEFGEGLPNILPAFVHTHEAVVLNETVKTNKIYGVIRCDPLILKGLEKTARHMVIPYLPMLVPPLKWTRYDKGAYFFLPSHVMRMHGSKPQLETMKEAPRQQLESVYEALDTLGRTKWRVNKRVLDVVERLWASGGGEAGLVDCNDIPLSEQPATEDEEEIKKWKREIRAAKKENMEKHGHRCDIELKLAVARKLKDEEGFYYPHNLDFRGRAYPMHPHLNHLGSDLCRGILEFAEGRPLGKSGLRWLKIHLANVYAGGVDKLPYEGREAFTDNHREEIVESANSLLGGKRWWLNAEHPFQCLATCITLTEAWQSSSPETTISHIHVHQDGSCNGLQHYAALGRDKLGAAAVNLVGGEKPADVYSGIAARVHDIMRRDAEADPQTFSDAVHARLLVNEVDRKLVKQTVMTSVYGVTFIGARDQITKRLKERNIDDAMLFPASIYAAKTTMTALSQMFEAARSIMDWLGECAKIIAGKNELVRWTTPLGLPVVQPYQHSGKHLVKTSLQVLALKVDTDKVLAPRQKTAFPPNFVHSLDSTHMMMTALACKRAGLVFAGVHDSYWTHACDVDEMNRILREKFVELYEAPILENLLQSFKESFPGSQFPPLPKRGDFDLRDVLQSTYFFN